MNASTHCQPLSRALLGAWMIGLLAMPGMVPPGRGADAPCQAALDAIVTQVLARQPDAPCPGTIAGAIRHRSLRTSWGWLILLFNDPAAAGQSQPSAVAVDLRSVRPCRIRELLSGEVFDHDRFEMTVAPASYRILQVHVGQFEPEYFWEYFEADHGNPPPVRRFLCELY